MLTDLLFSFIVSSKGNSFIFTLTVNAMTKLLNFNIDVDLHKRLTDMAAKTDSSVSKFVRDAIRERIDRIEENGKVETTVIITEKVAA